MTIQTHEVSQQKIDLPVTGMSCGGCAQTVQQALSGLNGVTAVTVSHAEAKAHIHFMPEQITVAQIQGAIRKAGYEVGNPLAPDSIIEIRLKLVGQSCCCAKK